MADDDKLAIYAELHRRGQVPDEHKPIVDELVKRGVIKGADRTFGGDEDLQKQYGLAKKFTSPVQRRILDSATLGGGDEVLAGLGALVETPFSNRTLGENYDRQLKVQRALRDDARTEVTGAAGFGADVLGGLAMMPGRAVAAAGSAVAPIGTETWRQGGRRIAGEIAANAPQLAKVGAAYGAGNAFLGADGSSDPNASMADNFSNRAAAIPGGAVEGAVGALTIGNALHTGLGIRDIRRGQRADRADRQMLNRMQWEAEGMTAPGYAITESPSARATAQSLSDSIIGGSLRSDAAARTAALEARAQQITREQTGGAPSNDLGANVQRSLERNLHEYSTPNREIAGMPNSDLERIAGPVTQEGFRPPRPQVEPVQPRQIADMTPEQFAQEKLPGRVPQVEPKFEPIDPRSIDLPPELTLRGADFQSRVRDFNRKFSPGEVHKSSVEVSVSPPMRREQIEADSIANRYRELRAKYGRSEDMVPREVQDRLNRLAQRHQQLTEAVRPMREQHAALLEERKQLAAAIEDHVSAEFSKRSREQHAKASEAAQAETLRQNAIAETEARRVAAQQEAERATQAARDAANRAYDSEIANSPNGFRAGRTQESYPTEFAAGYERVLRETPPVNRNPLGGRGQQRTATEGLINDFALDGFRGGSIQGYRHGEAFGIDGRVMHPDLMPYLRQPLGPEVARRLEPYAEARATPGGRNANYPDGFPLDIKTLRDLRTVVRQEAERRYMPGEPRTTDAAMLKRLEGALTEDLHAFQQQAGPQGQRSSQMMRGVDAEYARVAEELRRPLSRLYGDKVKPIDAMDRLAVATEKGDLQTLNAFMRVMAEKDNPTRAAAAIVSHMTEGASNLNAFVQGYGRIPRESRNALFRGEEGQALRTSYDRLEQLMGQLRPYQTPIANGGGIDFTRRVNLLLLGSAIAHPANTIALAGGGALLSRFMSSPRYVNWLTSTNRVAASGANSSAMMNHVARLVSLANSDPDKERGKAIIEATQGMIMPSRAKAATLSPGERANMRPLVEKTAFGGQGSATADAKTLTQAQTMDAAGTGNDETWKATGWAKGKDGKWRYEIDDTGSEVTKDGFGMLKAAKAITTPRDGLVMSLSAVLNHPKLFEAYPFLKNVPVEIFSEKANPMLKGVYGYFVGNKIIVNADKALSDPVAFRDTIMHEAQHGIQFKEGFYYGNKMGTGGKEYWSRPGEIEAMDVAQRRKMTPDQRRSTPPALMRAQ